MNNISIFTTSDLHINKIKLTSNIDNTFLLKFSFIKKKITFQIHLAHLK